MHRKPTVNDFFIPAPSFIEHLQILICEIKIIVKEYTYRRMNQMIIKVCPMFHYMLNFIVTFHIHHAETELDRSLGTIDI